MSKGTVNKVIILGKLGQDPDIRSTAGGLAVANLSVATNHSVKNQQGGYSEETEWHKCVVFGKTAENAQRYLQKGSSVYLEGRLKTRKWKDKDTGVDKYSTEIVCNDMQFIGGRQEQQPQNQNTQQHSPPPSQQPQYQQPAQQQTQGFDDFDDDIPF